jgi:GNAT superfamily N-acetyltransferase
MQIVVDPQLKADDIDAIRAPLHAFNDSKVDSPDGHFGVLIKDDDGRTIGGLAARWYYNWMFIELLFVPEQLRGQDVGTQLMAAAESYAREQGMVGIWLDTFGFQARGFYEKLGYRLFGELPDYPGAHSRYFLNKRL